MASLMNLFARTHGLIKIRPTVRVTDNYTLSLVYTPGVGHVCKVIEKDPDQLYDLCITGRSIALITDGSGYDHQDTDELIPNLEFESALYKLFYDLDAYPIILNSKKLDSVEKVISVIDNLSPVYKTQVFIGLSHQNAKNLEEAYKLRSASVIVSQSTTIDQHLSDAALAKALVDSRALLTVAETNQILREQFTFSGNILDQLVNAYSKYLHDIFKNSLEHKTRKGTDPETLINRLKDYFSYGDVANIKEWGQDHKIQNLDNNTNSVHLHNRYGGMIRIETHLQPKSLDQIYGLFGSAIKHNELDQLRKMIREDKSTLKKFTFKKYYAAIITNGTAILGLGDIGPSAGLPVMEGKSVLFNSLGGIDLMPICLKEKNVDKLVELIQIISPIFSSINLEDIKAPECFPIEQRCIESIPIPLMHDDQHGTAVVALAAIINGLKLLGKQPGEMKLVINGAGAAGVAIAKLLHGHGIQDIIICDTEGPIYVGRPKNMNPFKDQLASFTNPNKIAGTLKDAVIGRDIFIGVSAPGALTQDMIRSMNKDPFILALANPVPEIMPDEAYEAGAFIVATGRSDFNNQVNNSLAFPGIFRGAIDCSAKVINLEMKIAAAHAIADCIPNAELNRFKILPTALAVEIPAAVAKAVVLAAQKTGVAQHLIDAETVFDRAKKHIIEGYIPKL